MKHLPRMVDQNTINILDFLAAPKEPVSNYQRAFARFRLEPELIAIGAYLATMEVIADDSVGTAATDCVRKIWYSPTYFNEQLTVDECTSALIHECQHKFLNFFPRFERWAKQYKGQYTRKQLLTWFNIAQDYFINWMIKHEWKLPIRDSWMYDPKYNPTDHSTESIANELIKDYEAQAQAPEPSSSGTPDDECNGGGGGDDSDEETENQGGEGDDESSSDAGQDGDESSDDTDEGAASDDSTDEDTENDGAGEGDPCDPSDSELGQGDDIVLPEEYDGDINNELAETDIQSMEIDNRQDMSLALRAAKAAQGPGARGNGCTDPFTAEAEDAAYRQGFDFATELARHANVSNRRGKYTWYRPNRRLRTSQGLALPSRRGKSIGVAVFVIDSSGSTAGEVVRYFMDCAVEALNTVDYEKAVLIWCSDAVPTNGVQEFTKDEITNWKWDGLIRRAGCGTEFKPAFDVIEEHYPDVRCITYLTDGGVGTYDVDDAAAAIKRLNNVPCLYLLIDECGYSYVERFAEWVAERKAGRCAYLPLDRLDS